MSNIKCQLWTPSRAIITAELDSEFRILPNFRVTELANNQAKDDIKLVIGDERAWRLLEMLQLTRYRYGRMDLNSVYRTKSFNSSLKYADPNSCHLKCWAFDWDCPNQTDSQRQEKAQWWKDLCTQYGEVGAINFYTSGYHCEIGSDVQYGQTSFKIRDYRGKAGDW